MASTIINFRYETGPDAINLNEPECFHSALPLCVLSILRLWTLLRFDRLCQWKLPYGIIS